MLFLEWGSFVLACGGTLLGVSALGWLISRTIRLQANQRSHFKNCLELSTHELGIVFDPLLSTSYSGKGRLEDFVIHVAMTGRSSETEDDMATFLDVSVEGPRIPAGLRFFAESGGGEDVLTGDPVFDDVVEVYGEPSVVCALLHRELRQRVAVFVRWGGRLEQGRLTLRTRVATDWDTPSMLRMTMALVRELASSERGGICERLAQNASADPLPGVRLLNLLQLQEEFAATPQASQTSKAALSDSAPWIRLAAARFLRDEGLPVLEAIARDRSSPDQAAAEAVGLLAVRLPHERSGPLLIEVLKSRAGDARRQAVDDLGRLRHAPALGPLIVLLDRADPRTAAAAAHALGQLGDAKAEASLLQAVTSEVHELRLAAATALGRVGSIRSIEPLTELQKKRLDAESRQAITQAIGRIQSRLAGAGAGQLSLAKGFPESGRLSLAAPVAGPGDVSLAPERRKGAGPIIPA